MRAIYCGAWEHTWAFVPPTEDEFRRLATELKPIFDERCAVCADVDGAPVACAIAIPDINQALKGTNGRLFPSGVIRLLRRTRYIDQVRLLLVGVLPAYRTRGLYPLLLFELQRQARGGGYRRPGVPWGPGRNRAGNPPAQQAGARSFQSHRVYQNALPLPIQLPAPA